MGCGDVIIGALARVGQESELYCEVLGHCEAFIYKLLGPKSAGISQVAAFRWFHFHGLNTKEEIEKLASTQGSLHKHIRQAHYQCLILRQALIPQLTVPVPTELGWSISDTSGHLVLKLSRIPLAPDSILRLVRCKCTDSQCSERCSSRENQTPCTELCKCDPDGCKNLTRVGEASDEYNTE